MAKSTNKASSPKPVDHTSGMNLLPANAPVEDYEQDLKALLRIMRVWGSGSDEIGKKYFGIKSSDELEQVRADGRFYDLAKMLEAYQVKMRKSSDGGVKELLKSAKATALIICNKRSIPIPTPSEDGCHRIATVNGDFLIRLVSKAEIRKKELAAKKVAKNEESERKRKEALSVKVPATKQPKKGKA